MKRKKLTKKQIELFMRLQQKGSSIRLYMLSGGEKKALQGLIDRHLVRRTRRGAYQRRTDIGDVL